MDLSTKIEFVLSQKFNPSEKVGLITLLVAERDLTTSELNKYNNCIKTFENYNTVFKETLKSGLVYTCPMKSSNGYMRQHFCINEDVLKKLIENN